MPKGTRVHRCVNKLKKKGTYSRAIAICQKATKQSYMTGKTLKKKVTLKKRRKTKRRKTKRRKGGVAKRPPRFNAAAMNVPNWRLLKGQLREREGELYDLETKLEKKKWCENEGANYNIQQLRTDIQKKRIEIEGAKEGRDALDPRNQQGGIRKRRKIRRSTRKNCGSFRKTARKKKLKKD